MLAEQVDTTYWRCLLNVDTPVKTIDFGGGILSLLPRSQRRSLKGGDIYGSLKGSGRFLSGNVLFNCMCLKNSFIFSNVTISS